MSGHFTDLINEFARLPGIGSRQARRIVEHLVRKDKSTITRFARTLEEVKNAMKECRRCARLFTHTGDDELCTICKDANRNVHSLMVVEKDIDLETIEKSGAYDGTYFVLGGLITLTEKSPSEKIRLKKLLALVDTLKGGSEVVLALSTTTDGEETALYIEEALAPLAETKKITITRLGRGLSTGAELEYADPVTIKNALTNRK